MDACSSRRWRVGGAAFACFLLLCITLHFNQSDPPTQHSKVEFSTLSRPTIHAKHMPQHTVAIVVEHMNHNWWTCLKRLAHFMTTLKRLGHTVILATVSGQVTPEWHETLGSLGVPVVRVWDLAGWTELDMVFYSTFWWDFNSVYETMSPSIVESFPDIRQVVIADDVGWNSMMSTARGSPEEDPFAWAQQNIQRHRQVRVYNHADAVVTITDSDAINIIKDMQALSEATTVRVKPHKKVFKVHYMVNQVLTQDHIPKFHERADAVVFVGNGFNPTNVKGMEWFVDSVWPLVLRTLPHLRLFVIGDGWERIASTQGIQVLGEKGDIVLYLNAAKVSVTPTVAGTGLNTKSLDYLSCGLPVVTTTRGSHALEVDDTPNVVVVVDEPAQFAQAIVELATNKTSWEMRSRASLEHVQTFFSAQMFAADTVRLLTYLEGAHHTARNWTLADKEPLTVPTGSKPPSKLSQGEFILFPRPLFDGDQTQAVQLFDENIFVLQPNTVGSMLIGPNTTIAIFTAGNKKHIGSFADSIAYLGSWSSHKLLLKLA